MPQTKDGCVKPARGPIAPAAAATPASSAAAPREEPMVRAQVGKEAPDFEANAFVGAGGFQPLKLSDYKGQWIVLCFYPGDFTFV